MWFGNTTLLLISGVLGIDPGLFEAADIDGATGWKKFRYITLPLLKPIMLYTLVTSAIGGLQMYDIPALFNVPETGLVGLPDDKTTTMAMYIMRLYNSDVWKGSSRFRSTVYYHVGCQSDPVRNYERQRRQTYEKRAETA